GWNRTEGGDGGDVVYGPLNPTTAYHVAPFGPANCVRKSTDGGANWSTIVTGIVNGANAASCPPIVADPGTAGRLLVGTNVVNVTSNGGANWGQLGTAVPGNSSLVAL